MTGTRLVPKALPGDPRLFVNRADELELLDREIAASVPADQVEVVVLTGLPGVGKTTLATRCAHRVKHLFRDGWLWASLGASSETVSVDDVLFLFLTQLGVEQPPATSQGLRAAFRTVTAELALLIVLDDVESAAQLTNLLPSSPRSLVLATSRKRSQGFRRERFTVIDVPPFSVASAVELISADLDGSRGPVDHADVAALADLCGRLPLALSIAGAQLSTRHTGPLADFVRQLRTAKSVLGQFTEDGKPLVAAVFEVSYQDLPGEVQRAYRLLSLHPGTRFSAGAAAALLDTGDPAARLDALVVAYLLTQVGPGRYEFHSLVREHAAGLAGEVEDPDACDAAVQRVVGWYLRFAVARQLAISDRRRFGDYFDGRVAPSHRGPDAWSDAIKELEAERANLRRVVRAAADAGLHGLAWQLCEALATFFFQRDLFDDAIAVHTVGLNSALVVQRETGDARPVLRMRTELGTAYFSANDDAAAAEQFEAAAQLAEGLPEDDEVVFTRAKMFQWKAVVHQRRGEFAAGVEAIEHARVLVEGPRFPAAARARELALLDLNGGPMLAEAGRVEEALAVGRAAVEHFRTTREQHNVAKAVANLGRSLTKAGPEARGEAERVLREALVLLSGLGMQFWEADSSTVLADLIEQDGRDAEAAPLLERAEQLYTILEDRRAQSLRDRLGNG